MWKNEGNEGKTYLKGNFVLTPEFKKLISQFPDDTKVYLSVYTKDKSDNEKTPTHQFAMSADAYPVSDDTVDTVEDEVF